MLKLKLLNCITAFVYVCSSVWLECHLDMVEVSGSSPLRRKIKKIIYINQINYEIAKLKKTFFIVST